MENYYGIDVVMGNQIIITRGYNKPRLIRALKKFHRRHYSFVKKFDACVTKIALDIFDVT